MLDRMLIKGDFLRNGYPFTFEEWQNTQEELIGAIVSNEGNLLESFQWYCKGLYYDYDSNHDEMKNLDKRTKEYKNHLKDKATCKKIMHIAEGFILDDIEDVIDQYSTEIEELYDEFSDKFIVMEAAYTAQVYVYAAKCQQYYNKRCYVIGKNIAGAFFVNGSSVNLDDILDVTSIDVYEKGFYARAAMKEKEDYNKQQSCVIRCYPVLLDGNFEPVKVRLNAILEN